MNMCVMCPDKSIDKCPALSGRVWVQAGAHLATSFQKACFIHTMWSVDNLFVQAWQRPDKEMEITNNKMWTIDRAVAQKKVHPLQKRQSTNSRRTKQLICNVHIVIPFSCVDIAVPPRRVKIMLIFCQMSYKCQKEHKCQMCANVGQMSILSTALLWDCSQAHAVQRHLI